MKRFESVLLPLDGSPEAAKAIPCALWLAQALGATLHIVHVGRQSAPVLPAEELLTQLGASQVQDQRVILHQCRGNAARRVLETIAAQQIALVVMSAQGESAPVKRLRADLVGSIARAVIEAASVPVVLLPAHYREVLPWTSILVAASGEPAADRAMERAVPIAAALGIEVTAMHCEEATPGTGTAALASYADAPYHEYAHRLEHMMDRGLAHSTAGEAGCVCGLLLRRGDPASVLLEHVARRHSSVLALGWHGRLDAGRARVLKRLIDEAECPLLIVREVERPRARLNVGNDFG